MIAISSLQFKYRTAALNTLTLHPFLIYLPACHSQASQRENPEAKYLHNMRITSACALCHARGMSRGSCQGVQDTKCLCMHFCATRHIVVASCSILLHNQKESKAPNPATSCYQNPQSCCAFHCFSSGKNLIIKMLKHQTTEAQSKAALQSVPDTPACEHPERVTGTKRLCQLYSVQNLLLSTATFSLGTGTEQGKKPQLWMRQQQAGPAWRSQWAECAGLELEPGQGKLKAQGSGKRRRGHQRTPNLQTCDLLAARLKLESRQGLQESKNLL